ncbi:YppG family protein [Bacillus sp. Marseille-P3661]|uniref:YppG family protein n=1 Tax=Bacillus sp. Marseille-P3661 TaxID=1936234 RepID=UPI000C84DE4A|nr:YppG family protein [Bacillus sp. Marseille-P3661]
MYKKPGYINWHSNNNINHFPYLHHYNRYNGHNSYYHTNYPHSYNYLPINSVKPLNHHNFNNLSGINPYHQHSYYIPPTHFNYQASITNQQQTTPIRPPAYSLMSYFQDKNGQLDLDKMLTTVGKVSTTFQQVSPLFKQLTSLFTKVK